MQLNDTFQESVKIVNNNNNKMADHKKSLFFDKAIASKFLQKSNVSTLSSSPLSSVSSSQTRSFGNWSNFRKYFSFPTLNTLENCPQIHSNFKPVISNSKYLDDAAVLENETMTYMAVDNVYETGCISSQNSSISDLCSQTSSGQVDSGDSESSNSGAHEDSFNRLESLDGENCELLEKETEEVSHFFMRSHSTPSRTNVNIIFRSIIV